MNMLLHFINLHTKNWEEILDKGMCSINIPLLAKKVALSGALENRKTILDP